MSEYSARELLAELEGDEQHLKNHKESFDKFFQSGAIDFAAIFDIEDFNVHTGKSSKKHMEEIGLKLVVAYRDSFEEENEYWGDI
jgi:hypothetical protein